MSYNQINSLKLNLSEIIRKKHINCKRFNRNCSYCEYFSNKKCELELLKNMTLEHIKLLS